MADTILEFDNTNNTSPNVTDVKNTFVDAIKNGNFSFPVDAASVNVTDITIGKYLFRYIVFPVRYMSVTFSTQKE